MLRPSNFRSVVTSAGRGIGWGPGGNITPAKHPNSKTWIPMWTLHGSSYGSYMDRRLWLMRTCNHCVRCRFGLCYLDPEAAAEAHHHIDCTD